MPSTAAMAAALLSMTSACGQPEPPRTASDFCLVSKRLTAEPAPAAGQDDPGNRFDTDETLSEVIEHNQVYDRLCVNR
ncbi:hypothetical protein [Novosphingobium sp. ST904]|uniref:hypothetical protein n=1 Tax=Novosphingobium sp. ST904 TaxID=1684385 RepID=UPI0014051A48|nr:hypothetical protein [Novosphingobium sp. ST904]